MFACILNLHSTCFFLRATRWPFEARMPELSWTAPERLLSYIKMLYRPYHAPSCPRAQNKLTRHGPPPDVSRYPNNIHAAVLIFPSQRNTHNYRLTALVFIRGSDSATLPPEFLVRLYRGDYRYMRTSNTSWGIKRLKKTVLKSGIISEK